MMQRYSILLSLKLGDPWHFAMILSKNSQFRFNIREKTRKDPLATGVYFEARHNFF